MTSTDQQQSGTITGTHWRVTHHTNGRTELSITVPGLGGLANGGVSEICIALSDPRLAVDDERADLAMALTQSAYAPATEVAQLRAELDQARIELSYASLWRTSFDTLAGLIRTLNSVADEMVANLETAIKPLRATQGIPVPQPTTEDAEAGSGELRAESEATEGEGRTCRCCEGCDKPIGDTERQFIHGDRRWHHHCRPLLCQDASGPVGRYCGEPVGGRGQWMRRCDKHADSSGEATA